MNLVTINIGSKESENLACPQCGNLRPVVFSKLPRRFYKARCKCMHEFIIKLNRRKHIRKTINLIGTYSFKRSFANNIIDVIDLSKDGLGFIRTDTNILNVSDTILINFNLDNSVHDTIESSALIINICNNRVCVEFASMKDRIKTTLGFYFL